MAGQYSAEVKKRCVALKKVQQAPLADLVLLPKEGRAGLGLDYQVC